MSDLPPPAPSSPRVRPDGEPGTTRRPPRAGELTASWRVATILTWVVAFLATMGVWKASVEIGIATWWLGPRSGRQPVLVQLVPFYIIVIVGILVSYNLRRLPWVTVVGSVALAIVAIPDISRQSGLALVEFAIAGATLLVALGSFTGRYRAAGAAGLHEHDGRDTPSTSGTASTTTTGQFTADDGR